MWECACSYNNISGCVCVSLRVEVTWPVSCFNGGNAIHSISEYVPFPQECNRLKNWGGGGGKLRSGNILGIVSVCDLYQTWVSWMWLLVSSLPWPFEAGEWIPEGTVMSYCSGCDWGLVFADDLWAGLVSTKTGALWILKGDLPPSLHSTPLSLQSIP